MKACAFMSIFNEEDIIEETIQKLIFNDIDVFVIDNGCTDNTINLIQKYVGHGIIDIRNHVFKENGREVFNLHAILDKFESYSKILGYEWYLISDADEIKYSPWPDFSLLESIEKVNNSGFNLINFKLFNFRPTFCENSKINDYESAFEYFEAADAASSIQMKCWRHENSIDIKKFGGHLISTKNPQLYPASFINKHYPIRNPAHGQRKISHERIGRYSQVEINQGWHTHYTNTTNTPPESLVWDPKKLQKFDLNTERLKILTESLDSLAAIGKVISKCTEEEIINMYKNYLLRLEANPQKNVEEIIKVVSTMNILSSKFALPEIHAGKEHYLDINLLLTLFKMLEYYSGNLLKFKNMSNVKLKINTSEP